MLLSPTFFALFGFLQDKIMSVWGTSPPTTTGRGTPEKASPAPPGIQKTLGGWPYEALGVLMSLYGVLGPYGATRGLITPLEDL